MLVVKLLSREIKEYQDVINETLDRTIPEYQEEMKTKLFEELLLDQAQCWVVRKPDGVLEGIGITRIDENISVGCKVLEIVSIYALNGTQSSTFLHVYEVVSKFALANGCTRFAGYTNNQEMIKYIRMFDIVWESQYFQIRL